MDLEILIILLSLLLRQVLILGEDSVRIKDMGRCKNNNQKHLEYLPQMHLFNKKRMMEWIRKRET
jgi:hypothetical protein